MSKNHVISLENPEENTDILTGLLRSGAKELITRQCNELAEFLSLYSGLTDGLGRRQVVRNGYQPKRKVMTGL